MLMAFILVAHLWKWSGNYHVQHYPLNVRYSPKPPACSLWTCTASGVLKLISSLWCLPQPSSESFYGTPPSAIMLSSTKSLVLKPAHVPAVPTYAYLVRRTLGVSSFKQFFCFFLSPLSSKSDDHWTVVKEIAGLGERGGDAIVVESVTRGHCWPYRWFGAGC